MNTPSIWAKSQRSLRHLWFVQIRGQLTGQAVHGEILNIDKLACQDGKLIPIGKFENVSTALGP